MEMTSFRGSFDLVGAGAASHGVMMGGMQVAARRETGKTSGNVVGREVKKEGVNGGGQECRRARQGGEEEERSRRAG